MCKWLFAIWFQTSYDNCFLWKWMRWKCSSMCYHPFLINCKTENIYAFYSDFFTQWEREREREREKEREREILKTILGKMS